MIEIKELNKSYFLSDGCENKILANFIFSLDVGQNVVITGDNGTGKSTFLRIVGLLDKKYSGIYKLVGKDVNLLSRKEIARARNECFGYLFQDFRLIENESVYNNIIIPLYYSNKFKKNERKDRMEEILRELKLENLSQVKVRYLSGGEKQIVAFARAIVNRPKVLLLDEPTSSLSREGREKILNIIERYLSKDKSMIIVTHDYDTLKFCLSKSFTHIVFNYQ